MAEGIEVRHARSCASRTGKRCNCDPGYRVTVYDVISRRKASKTFRTLGEARRWRATAQTQAARGVRLSGTAQPLLEAAEALVEGMTSGAIRTHAGARYRPSVVREYERSLRLHVLPTLGGAKLAKIQRRDVQRLVDDMLASGADPSTIRNALKPLQVIYRRANEDGDLAVNPCERLRLPTAAGRRERIAAPAEAAALVAALRPDDRALWGCAFYAGLRLGELRGLAWSDVDLATGLIRVQRSMSSRGETGEPKSRAGRRTVPIIAALRDLLIEHKLVTQRAEGFIFGSSATAPFTPTAVRRRALTAWRRAGLDPIGLHECRHTFASLLIAAGVNAKAITAYLGHASIQTTFDL
jgi:integrase